MDDRNGDRPRDDHQGGGPPETDWLDLEISKLIEGKAEDVVRLAIDELLADHIKARLMERLGPRLQAVGKIVADRLADDIEANLDIEARIDARREARRSAGAQIAEALRRREDPEKT